MKNVRFIALILLCVISITTLCGCNSNPYNAVLYDSAVDWIKEDFVLANPIKTVGFIDENPEGQNPKSRVFIVKDQQRYDEIFISGIEELQIDFNSQMLIVYTFGDETVNHRMLTKTEIKNGCLTITFDLVEPSGKGNYGGSCQPYQRWFVVKIDKMNIEKVKFVEK